MYYKNPFQLHAFLFLVLTVLLSSTAVAKDRGAIPTQAQTAGAQVSGLVVRLEQVSGGKVLTTRTDERGSFSFTDVGPGSYKLRIGCTGTSATSSGVADVAGVQNCQAEFRVEITDKSKGVIKGAIKRER